MSNQIESPEPTCIIYCWRFVPSKPHPYAGMIRYVGQCTTDRLEKRKGEHLNHKSLKGGRMLHKEMKVTGGRAWRHEVLERDVPESRVRAAEQHWVDELMTEWPIGRHGLNLTQGGETNRKGARLSSNNARQDNTFRYQHHARVTDEHRRIIREQMALIGREQQERREQGEQREMHEAEARIAAEPEPVTEAAPVTSVSTKPVATGLFAWFRNNW